jgi:hypothetical protein
VNANGVVQLSVAEIRKYREPRLTTSLGEKSSLPPFATKRRFEKALTATLERFCGEREFDRSQMIILTDTAVSCSEITEWLRSEGAPDIFRNVLIETIARFKGLEAEAVAVVVTEDNLELTRTIQNLYLSMSRARIFFDVIAPQNVINAISDYRVTVQRDS